MHDNKHIQYCAFHIISQVLLASLIGLTVASNVITYDCERQAYQNVH